VREARSGRGVRGHGERAAAAEAALAASARAELDARARFEAGAGTQIEAILSERDRFSAEVGRIQALAELRVARAALRTRAGLPLD
jgi:outer membrane protein TolC